MYPRLDPSALNKPPLASGTGTIELAGDPAQVRSDQDELGARPVVHRVLSSRVETVPGPVCY